MWFPTFSGKRIDLEEIDRSQINLVDIAHALSMIPRYNGHGAFHMSVAEHCVRLSFMVPQRVSALALMHDAAEYVMGDLARPVKALLPGYQELEDRFLRIILKVFDLDSQLNTPEAASMWRVDQVYPLVECKAGLLPVPENMPPMNGEWSEEYISMLYLETTLRFPEWGWTHLMAEHMFLVRAAELHIKYEQSTSNK